MSDHHTAASGNTHTLIVDSNSSVWSFGDGRDRQLGRYSSTVRTVENIEMIEDLPPIVSVACGSNHSLALDVNGKVWGFGYGYYGQLGTLEKDDKGRVIRTEIIPEWADFDIVSISAGDTHSIALDSNGKLHGLGSGIYFQERVPYVLTLYTIVKISAGLSHNIVLDKDGKVYSFGRDDSGRLGRLSTTSEQVIGLPPIVEISAGEKHNLLVDNDGYIWAFGDSEYGVLGNGRTSGTVYTPVKISEPHNIVAVAAGFRRSLALDKDGQLWYAGSNSGSYQDVSTFKPITGLPSIKSLSPGIISNVLLDQDDKVIVIRNINIDSRTGILSCNSTAINKFVGKPAELPIPTVEISYPLVRSLLDQNFFVNYGTRRDLPVSAFPLAELKDVMMEFEDAEGHFYIARVQYDADQDKVSKPDRNEQYKYYSDLEYLLKNGQLMEFEFRPDLYQDELGNEAFAYKLDNTIYILIVNKGEDGQIYPFVE